MTIDDLYDDALRRMASTLAAFEKHVSPPRRVPYKDGFVFRYTERTTEQACRSSSGRAPDTLLVECLASKLDIIYNTC